MTEPLVSRMRAFGTTIFAEMSALAVQTGSINLGQGFPDTDGPAAMLDRAVQAITSGANQYPPGPGVLELRQAVSEHRMAHYRLDYDPAAEVLVTVGATEAIAASVLALCEPGDEVIAFEPYYDSYAASIALAQARLAAVTLRPVDGRFTFDPDELRAAVTPRTRAILVNSPHNPTGTVFTRDELTVIAELCQEHGLIAITDEVYEHLTFDGVEHVPNVGRNVHMLRIPTLRSVFL
ncbi:aminotransferase class I/II-fold pyridoxal phosphate-dependent enzyme, partial [Nonomuraea sp. NPDC001684]